MGQAEQEAGTPAWFDGGAKAGQEEPLVEEGAELAVEGEEELDEVSPAELQPPAAELKAKDEPIKKAMKIPQAEKGNRRAPSWAKVPKDLKFPKGIDVIFAKIPASFTMYPSLGERQVILWPLTDGDERLAYGRATSPLRAPAELTKQMVRAIDGERINWTGNPSAPGADIDRFWHEVGPRGRDLLQRLHIQMNTVTRDEGAHFFEHCVAAVNTG